MRIVKPMSRFSAVKSSSLLLALVLVTALSAKADEIPSLSSVTDLLNGTFAFNYIVNVSGSARLDPTASGGVACPGIGGLVKCNPAGTFFTIYDIPGFVSATTFASGWSAFVQMVGVTPSAINGNSIDNPTLPNVSFFYTGPVVIGPFDMNGFQIISRNSGVGIGSFTSQATNNTSDSLANGTTLQSSGSVSVPADGPAPTPEPRSLLLLGGGLLGLAGIARRTRLIGWSKTGSFN